MRSAKPAEAYIKARPRGLAAGPRPVMTMAGSRVDPWSALPCSGFWRTSPDRIDVVVVYKVDRLTRSLADFAKLVELFDAHGVSFVSVTQAFNTTTSMGRLTLNVLLSFAQFEREVTGERIRDKIAASKKKGLWMGGMVPLGYEVETRSSSSTRRKPSVSGSSSAATWSWQPRQLMQDLRERGIVTKVRHLSNGRTIGGIPFTRGSLAYLLRNRFYIGEVRYRGEVCLAQHPAILDRDLFEAVQQTLSSQHCASARPRGRSDALLMGRLYDDAGNRMTPAHANKGGVRYRYYVSAALSQGRPRAPSPACLLARSRQLSFELCASAIRSRTPSTTGL